MIDYYYCSFFKINNKKRSKYAFKPFCSTGLRMTNETIKPFINVVHLDMENMQ